MVEAAVKFFREYEISIYVFLGLVTIYAVIRLVGAWEEFRKAAFGMERESAQGKLNQAATMLFLLVAMAVMEFSLVTFVAPTMPGANPIPSPTLDFLATPTSTQIALIALETPEIVGTLEPTSTMIAGQGCTDQVMITSPADGESVSGVVVVEGTADIPNFGFYKYEIARPGETIWLSINAGEQVVQQGVLGEWVTSVLPPGEYQLRLVVADNQGKFLPACIIQVRIISE
jgi:hypothetical protein